MKINKLHSFFFHSMPLRKSQFIPGIEQGVRGKLSSGSVVFTHLFFSAAKLSQALEWWCVKLIEWSWVRDTATRWRWWCWRQAKVKNLWDGCKLTVIMLKYLSLVCYGGRQRVLFLPNTEGGQNRTNKNLVRLESFVYWFWSSDGDQTRNSVNSKMHSRRLQSSSHKCTSLTAHRNGNRTNFSLFGLTELSAV